MDVICYTCGDKGWEHTLVVCTTCKGLAVHRYCMKLIGFTEEIEWSCEDCKANTDPVKQCRKVIKDIEINEFCVKRKRDKEEDFCQNNGNTVLVGRKENVTNTTTSFSSDSQGWSKKGLKENSWVEVNRKRRKEKGHHLDNNNQHDTKVEMDPLPKNDGNKVDCNKKLDIVGRKASVGEAVIGEIQDDSIETNRVVQIHQHSPSEKPKIPSCCVKGECMGKAVINKGELLLVANELERDNLAGQNGENALITDTCVTAIDDTRLYPIYQKATRDVGLHQIDENYLVRDPQANQNDRGETVKDDDSGASIGETHIDKNDKNALKGDAQANFVGANALTADVRVYQNDQNALSAEIVVVRDSNVVPVREVKVNDDEKNASDGGTHSDLLDHNAPFRGRPDNRNAEAISIEESQVVNSSKTAYIRETHVDGRDENALARYQLQAGRCTINTSSEGKWATRNNRIAPSGKIYVNINDKEVLMRDNSFDQHAKFKCSLVGQNHNSGPGEVTVVGEKDNIDAIEEICIVGNDKNDPLSEIQAGQSDKNVSLVTAEPAPISALLLASDIDVRNKSNHNQVQEPDHQCTVPGFLPAEENNKSMSNGDAQLDRTNSAVNANIVVESDKNKPTKSNEDAKVGDTQVAGMKKKISLIWKAPLRTVKSVHQPWNVLTLSDPRSKKAHSSAQAEPMHMIQRSTEQETHDLRSCKIDNGLTTDAVDGVHQPRGARNVHDRRFRRRRWEVKPEDMDRCPEFLERSNGDLRGKSMDLIHRQSLEPKVTNFGYVPVQSLFDFVWNGWFKIEGAGQVPLGGHTSTMIRVNHKDVPKSLPQVMSLEKVSCPCRFETTALTGHHVDLFFFPLVSRAEEMVDVIIQDMLNGNHVLKFKIDDIELHILSSCTFPEPSRSNFILAAAPVLLPFFSYYYENICALLHN